MTNGINHLAIALRLLSGADLEHDADNLKNCASLHFGEVFEEARAWMI